MESNSGPTSNSITVRFANWLQRNYDALVPCVVIVLFVQGIVFYQFPTNFDTLDESWEPLKTLKFMAARGALVHKWGPLPCLIYGPLYVPWLASWYATGTLKGMNTDYPYGLAHPFEQQGALIVTARLAGLVIALVCLFVLAKGLRQLTGSGLATLLAMLLCVATGPDLIYKFVATKPDGLMLAFLAASMGCYARIVADGLTYRRAIALGVLATFSVSCKEQTVPAYLLPFAGMLVAGLRRSDGPADRRRFLSQYLTLIAAGAISYVFVNVIYAPSAYLGHVREVFGPLKDPSIWGSPQWSLAVYLGEALRALIYNLGPGGTIVVALALVVSVVAPVPHRLLLWLPLVSYTAIVVATAGYMPRYFLSPTNVLVTLPVASVLAHLGRRWPSLPRPTHWATAAALVVALVLNAWVANFNWARTRALPETMIQDYCLRSVGRDEIIHTANMNERQPGADRLSYLGFRVDDRALGELMQAPAEMPDVILITGELAGWLADFQRVPNRDKVFTDWSGYKYSEFQGIESLGYRLVTTVRPDLPAWLRPPWRPWPWYDETAEASLLVYRRDPKAPQP